MARIRTIKPEFWTSEQVVECSPIARLLFVGMWNFCDDGGNHPASAKTLKMQIFPGDDIAIHQVDAMVGELIKAGLLQKYTADGRNYWHVTGWKHQKIDKPSYKHPRPFDDNSTNDSRELVERQPAEGKGREGNGMESTVVGDSRPSADGQAYLDRVTKHENANQPVTMTTDWQPGEQFPALMMRAGMKADRLTDEILSKFVIHHNGTSKPQNKWEAALVAWCKREQAIAPKNGQPGRFAAVDDSPMLKEYQPPVLPERTPEMAENARKHIGKVRELLG